MLSIVRLFSSTQAFRQLIAPPVAVFGLDGRYATALYSAAVKLQQLDQVEKDLQTVSNAIQTDGNLKAAFEDRFMAKKVKIETIQDMAVKANLTQPTLNFLVLMADNERLYRFEGILFAFSTIMSAYRGDLRCEVTTARPLDEDDKLRLETILKSFAKRGENVVLTLFVDPSLIGGMVLNIGDLHVDMSVSTKIKKYEQILESTS